MTDKAALLALADKLEKATEEQTRDREWRVEVRTAIADALFKRGTPDEFGKPRWWFSGWFGYELLEDAPNWLFSIDDAKTLVPEEMSPSIGQNVHHKHWNAFVLALKDDEPVTVASATASFAAIAMCAAALRARAA